MEEYCGKCMVLFMDGNCFCDWPDNEDVEYEKHCAERLLEQYEAEGKSQEFKDKLKSISFNRVRGGGRE